MKRVAIIGFGALGRIVAGAWESYLGASYELTGIYEKLHTESRMEIVELGYRAYPSIEELLSDRPDYVIELAGVGAVREYGQMVLACGSNLIAASIGALADDELRKKLEWIARENGVKIYLPSGAIGGFDVFQTVALMGDAKGSIDTYKAPAGLNGAPYLEGRMLSETEAEVVFQGNARAAIEGFPKNVNVAVSSGLASVGLDEMTVTIHSQPGLTENMHRIVVANETVKATLEVASKPDKSNPKSSVVTAWSVIALLRNLSSTIQMF